MLIVNLYIFPQFFF